MNAFRNALYYAAGAAHVLFMLLLILATGGETLSISTVVGNMPVTSGPTNLFGPADFKGPRNESDPGLWLVPDDFDPETNPYDSFRGYFVYFPLEDALINFGNSPSFDFGEGDFTVIFWYNEIVFQNRAPSILRKHAPAYLQGSKGLGFEVRDWADGNHFELGFVLTLPEQRQVTTRAKRILYHEPGSVWKSFHEKVGSREWCSFAAVRKGSQLLLYMDNVLVDEAELPDGASFDNQGDLILGNHPVRVDELSIWGRALTVEKMEALAKRSPEGTEDGLLGYWDFEEGGGKTAHDRSASGNHGTIVSRHFGQAQALGSFLPILLLVAIASLVPAWFYFAGKTWAKWALVAVYSVALLFEAFAFVDAYRWTELMLLTLLVPTFGVLAALLSGERQENGS
jgi:hypothetical protein